MSSSSPLTCCRFLAWCQVEVCCFDKTGTLTSDHLLLEEVVGPGKGDVCDLVMATCQSLVQLEGGDMVGDPLEKASLEVSGRKGACRMIAPPTRTCPYLSILCLAGVRLDFCQRHSHQSRQVLLRGHHPPSPFQLEPQAHDHHRAQQGAKTRMGTTSLMGTLDCLCPQ
jgi:hypothetical protein